MNVNEYNSCIIDITNATVFFFFAILQFLYEGIYQLKDKQILIQDILVYQ